MKYCPHFNDWRLVTLPGLTCQILPGSFPTTSFTRKRGKCKLNSQWSLFLQKIFASSQGEGQVPFFEWIFCRLPCSSLLTLTYKFPRFPSLSARFPRQAKEGAVQIVQKASSGSDLQRLCPLWFASTLSQGHPGTAIVIVYLQKPPTRDTTKGGRCGLVVLQLQGYTVRIMANNASSSFLTSLKNASMHMPEVFILKSIVLIVLFGKINEKLGRKKWDPGLINTKRLEWSVVTRACLDETAIVLEDRVSSWKPQVVAMGEERFSCYKNVPDICGQSSCLLLASGVLRASIPILGRMGLSSHRRTFKSQRSDIQSKFSHLLALWPWEGHLTSLLYNGGSDTHCVEFRRSWETWKHWANGL